MRRAVDLVAASALLVLLAPLLLLLAVVVRAGVGTPVLFRQTRVGRSGAPFRIVKLRTMRAEAFPGEPDAVRLSAVGRAMRASSLDELPQLWNIVRGDMSFVGPRPTLPEQVARYGAYERRRLEVLPGVTGWAQVNGRNDLSWPERIRLDVWYVDHRSAALDLRILAMTLVRLVRPSGVTAPGGVNPGFPGTDPRLGEP